MSVHWSEAVAVVEGLCEALPAGGGATVVVPELHDVLITSRGTVMVRKGAGGFPGIDELGRILTALLDPADTPMPLRLFVAHAAGSGKYPTVAAYAEALAYYARPGRVDRIRALYERCLEAPVPAVDVAPVTAPAAPAKPAAPPARRRGSIRSVPILAVLLLGAAGAGAAFWARGRDVGEATAVTTIRNAVTSVAGVVRDRLGIANVDDTLPADPAPAAGRAPRRQPAAPPDPVEIVPDVIVNATSLLPPVLLLDGDDVAVVEGGLAIPPDTSTLSPALPLPTPGGEVVYSSSAGEVQPPVMVSPKLPSVSAMDQHVPGKNTMELLIDESGRVEHVRLVSPPVRMSDMMLLSGAKTWRFHPALKDGTPVKYRLTVSWIVAPP